MRGGWKAALAILARQQTKDTVAAAVAAQHHEDQPAPPLEPGDPAPPPALECEQCGNNFDSFAARLGHMAKQHGYRTPYRAYAASGTCPCCMTTF